MTRKSGTPSKSERYRMVLKSLDQWDPFLLAESGLPGPRANLELAQAAVDVAAPATLWAYQGIAPEKAPEDSQTLFLPVVGTIGLGRLAVEGDQAALPRLRDLASDLRWRIREAVVMALQRIGDADMDQLLTTMAEWSQGNLLEKRAVVAALCEPRLLEDPPHTRKVFDLLDRITADLEQSEDRGYAFKVLRQTLGYGWSVAAAALPEEGKQRMERWMTSPDKDVRWVMKENLTKNRLRRVDPAWVEGWQKKLGEEY